MRQFKGGQSNPTYQLITPNRKYVLRRKPPGKLLPSAHAVDREFRIISALHPTGFPVAKPYLLCEDESVIGTMFYVMDCVEGRIYWGPLLPDQTPKQRGAIYDAMNETFARLHNLDWEKLGLQDFGKPGNYVARQIARWTKQYKASETQHIPEMERLIEWLPQHLPTRRAQLHRPRRLPPRQHDPAPHRAQGDRGARLGAFHHRRSDGRFHLSPDAVADAGRCLERRQPAGRAISTALGIPTLEEYTAMYCRRTDRDRVPNMDYYAAYNFFRLAGILQGIVGRVRDGTAANANAAQNEAGVRPLAERAWYFAQRAGAVA